LGAVKKEVKMDSQPKQETNHLENMSHAMNVARAWVLTALSLWLYVVTRQCVVALQKFTWVVWGIERVRRDARRGLQFKQSAHVQEVSSFILMMRVIIKMIHRQEPSSWTRE
jgi:hypothetical protein